MGRVAIEAARCDAADMSPKGYGIFDVIFFISSTV